MNAVEKRFYQQHVQHFRRERSKWFLLKAGHRLYMRGALDIPDLTNLVITAGVPLRSFYASFPSGEVYIRSLLEWEIRCYFRLYRDSAPEDFQNAETIHRWVERILNEFCKGKNLVRLFWHTLSMDSEFINYFHLLKREMVFRLGKRMAVRKGSEDDEGAYDLNQMFELYGIVSDLESALLHVAYEDSDSGTYVINDVVNRFVKFCCSANAN